ncbi:restriction endonuclease subunit S [Clostridium perfringens]|uniref:restriction endonuclease subunit S n=1 Tax=Clostridium perfringens TaxID=1502 RepID=UPI0024BCDEB1|nr:restriction endonuclease subunit S [Clostridium perfringens]MDM0956061.1 restriction endonuclease subunit S [Clostridium perfringens]
MKFRYRNEDEMKDSDIEWIGKIPKHWNSIMFKRVIQRVNNGIWGDDAKSNSDDIPCIRVLNFNRNTMEVKIDNLTIRNIPRIKQKGYLLKKGDLLIEKSGGGEKSPVGFVVRYNYELPAVYANFMAKISLNNNTISEYIKYLCSAIYNRKLHLDSINQTTGIQNLDSEIYFKRYIALPNVLEQEKIAKFLDEKTAEFDSIISKKEALIKKLEEAKKSLISEVVTGKVKVIKTSDGYELVERKQEEMKDSGVEWLGDIPREWNIKKIKYVSSLKSGESITSDNIRDDAKYPVYGGNGLRGYTDRFTHKGKYILIGRQGALCGNINYTNDEFWASEHAIVVNPLLKVDTLWLGELLRSMNLNQYSISAAQPGLAVGMIENLSIPFIEYNKQLVISDFINKKILEIKTTVEKTKQQIEKLKEAKQSLISEAVTGKIEILE